MLLSDVYNRIIIVRKSDEYKKCMDCDCYFTLLYYMKEELIELKKANYQEMLGEISSEFNAREDVKMHQCLGCEPCPPAEWTSELIRRKQQK